MANMKIRRHRSMFPRMYGQFSGAAGSGSSVTSFTPGRSTMVLAAMVGTVPSVVAGLSVNRELWSGGLYNPDSAMRLARLDDIIAAGAPLHGVMRDGSGLGTVLHWSHLLDSLLLLLASPLAPLLGWHDALHIVGLAFGPLCMACLGIAVAWAVAPVAPQRFLWIAAAAAGSAPMIKGYGLLGVVHHHVLLVLIPVMAGGWALRLLLGLSDERRTRQCGIAIGVWAAAGIWLSPETLPFVLMAMGVLWAVWFGPTPGSMGRRRLANALASASGTMALLLTLAWLVDPPAAGLLAIEPDRLSFPFVLIALGATATAILACATARRIPPLLCGILLSLCWLAAFPQFLHGTSGLMTPEQAHAFFSNIGEMEPVDGFGGALEALLGGIFATAALCAFTWRAPPRDRIPLGFAIACASVLLVLASHHIRFAAYPSVAGAAMLPIVLASVGATTWTSAHQSLTRVAIVVLMITAPIMAPLAASAGPRAAQGGAGQGDAGQGKPCSVGGAISLLADHPGEIVLSNVNDTPDLLYRTRVLTVGSLYQRNPLAYMRLRAAWLEIAGDAPGPAFQATRATLVLACPGERPATPPGDPAPATLLDRLGASFPPQWLHRLRDAGPNGPVLYAVGH